MAFTSVNTNAQNVGGVLLVNEISNGPNGTKEYVELVAGATDSTFATNITDVSGWIIDDNNGIFSNGIGSGLGISQGHLRLTNDSLWQNIQAGTLIVLFNGKDYDTASYGPTGSVNSNFANAVANANTTGFSSDANGSIYVAVGLSKLVNANYYTPNFAANNYCGTASILRDTTWDVIGISNSCAGDGIQTRCPGCTSVSGEPTFYHGISYGTSMFAVASQGFLAGAHVTVDTPACGTRRVIYLNNAVTPDDAGNGAFWGVDSVNTIHSTPGLPNTTANASYISNIANFGVVFGRCQNTPIVTPPADTASKAGKGVVMVTEISNGPAGTCEYAELLVANNGTDRSDSVDIRGWILDDNSGNFSVAGCTTGVGISSGHYRFGLTDATWAKVPVGALIVVYNIGDNCYALPTSFTFDPVNVVYYIPVSNTGTINPGTLHLEGFNGTPAANNCIYCTTPNNTYTIANNWGNAVGFNNSFDAFQTRCPGCNSMFAGAPAFYHGFGYGPATGATAYAPISATVASLGGAVINGAGTASKFEFTGTTVAQFGNGTFWTKSTADAAGAPPASLGSINATLRSAVIAHALVFPICGATSTARQTNTNVNNIASESNGVYVYPNPATQTLFVEFPASETAVSVKLIDLNGRVIAEKSASSTTKVEFNVGNVAPGFYIYQVINNGKLSSGKVLINK